MAKRMPKGFREGHTGNLACPHRDVSCCPDCAKAHPEIVEVYGQHFWVGDPEERAALLQELADDEDEPGPGVVECSAAGQLALFA